LASAIAIITRWRWPPDNWCGQLVRIGAEPMGRIGNADLPEQLDDARSRFLAGQPLVQQQDFRDLPLDGVQRIERGHRLLEHDGDVIAAHLADVALRHRQEFPPLEPDAAGRVMRGGIRQKLHHRQRRHRLAGAGLADQRHRFALADIERDAIDREDFPVAMTEGDREVLNLQQGFAGVHASAFQTRSMSWVIKSIFDMS
jgi:hypothetical protein